VWYVLSTSYFISFALSERDVDGSSRVPNTSPETSENPETVVRASGDVPEGNPEFRTGMAEGSRAYRATDALLTHLEEKKSEPCPGLLGYSGLFYGNTPRLPGLGIRYRQPLLVHQWDPVPRKASDQLEQQDEGMPEVRGFQKRHRHSGVEKKPRVTRGLFQHFASQGKFAKGLDKIHPCVKGSSKNWRKLLWTLYQSKSR
jgi:hypothetical protein